MSIPRASSGPRDAISFRNSSPGEQFPFLRRSDVWNIYQPNDGEAISAESRAGTD